jgi:hypothetical protein
MGDAVDAIDVECGLATHEPSLPVVIKRALASARIKARTDPKQLAAYRAYVERVVKQCEADSELDGESAATQFIESVACMRIELDIDQHEASRWPSDCEAWCQKHLPQLFSEVQIAMKAVCDRATTRTLEHLVTVYRAMLEAYVAYV